MSVLSFIVINVTLETPEERISMLVIPLTPSVEKSFRFDLIHPKQGKNVQLESKLL
jgi:hypothetical protein